MQKKEAPMHLCPTDYITLIVLIFVLFGSWLFHSRNDGQFYRIYEKVRASNGIAPPSMWFGVIWFVIYALLVVAIFLFYFHDDTCRCRDSARHLTGGGSEIFSDDDDDGDDDEMPFSPVCLESEIGIGLQTATWVLIIMGRRRRETPRR